MVEYAILNNAGQIVEYRHFETELQASQIKYLAGKPLARKVVEQAKPNYNSNIQTLIKSEEITDTVVNRSWSVQDQNLATVKSQYKSQVDAAAEGIRSQFITGGAGQSMTYLEKSKQATAYLQDPAPNANNYQMLTSLVGIDGDSVVEVAQVVKQRHDLWITIGAQIESVRLGAKRNIDSANNVTAVYNIYSGLDWGLG